MKFSCPHCGQHIQVDDPVSGEEFACPDCGQVLVLPELPAARQVEPLAPVEPLPRVQKCPDCGNVVSLRAASCPHCGAPLAAYTPIVQPVQSTPICRNLADTYRPFLHYGIYVFCLISAFIFGYAAYLERQNFLKYATASLMILAVSTIIFKLSILMKCHRCGYDGKPRRIGGPNFCIFILLLICGVIPSVVYLLVHLRFFSELDFCVFILLLICGIIPSVVYLLLRPERLLCPNCGQEVIR